MKMSLLRGLLRYPGCVAQCEGEKKDDRRTDLAESAVRQWLRERPGIACCALCLAIALGQSDVELVRTAVGIISKRSPFLPGPCSCGEVGVRCQEAL